MQQPAAKEPEPGRGRVASSLSSLASLVSLLASPVWRLAASLLAYAWGFLVHVWFRYGLIGPRNNRPWCPTFVCLFIFIDFFIILFLNHAGLIYRLPGNSTRVHRHHTHASSFWLLYSMADWFALVLH